MEQLTATQSQPSPGIPPTLVTENLGLSYANQVAFSEITTTFNAGEITGIIGPSGCGKSSFLSCLNRLHELTPKTQQYGSVYLDDCNINTLKPLTLRRRVGMLFQKPTPFPLSIIRNLTFPLREHGIRDRRQLDEIVETSLQQVGLWDEVKDRLSSPALSLSGGQQQRLCLARALALTPEVLLMDEPCSALDPIASEIIEDLILQLRGNYTIIVVTHNLAQARRIADNVGVFWVQDGVGKLIEFGECDRIFNSPQHPLTQAYISGQRG